MLLELLSNCRRFHLLLHFCRLLAHTSICHPSTHSMLPLLPLCLTMHSALICAHSPSFYIQLSLVLTLQEDSEWQVVDAGSCVVHIFLDDYREEVDLEGLWGRPDGSNLKFLEPKQKMQTLQTIK